MPKHKNNKSKKQRKNQEFIRRPWRKNLRKVEEVAYLEKRNSRSQRNLSPEQGQSHRNENGMMAEMKQKEQMLGVGRERKTRVKERTSFLNPKNPKKLKSSGKPKGHAINTLNQRMPRGHVPYRAAIPH